MGPIVSFLMDTHQAIDFSVFEMMSENELIALEAMSTQELAAFKQKLRWDKEKHA